MSDYFGALLRSAGLAPVAGGTGSTALPGSGTAEPTFEAVEPSPAQTAGPQAHVGEPEPQATPTRTAQQDFTGPHGASQNALHNALHNAPASMAIPQPASAEPHPAVRAALEWVGADPAVFERIVPGTPRAPLVPPGVAAVAQPAAPQVVAHPAHASPGADRGGALPARQAASRSKAAAVTALRPAPAAAPEPAFELDLDLPRASSAARASRVATRSAAPAPQRQVEISIGTIHVSVDAPPAARAVVQPSAPPQRMPPAAPAERSAFSRSRLPRS